MCYRSHHHHIFGKDHAIVFVCYIETLDRQVPVFFSEMTRSLASGGGGGGGGVVKKPVISVSKA